MHQIFNASLIGLALSVGLSLSAVAQEVGSEAARLKEIEQQLAVNARSAVELRERQAAARAAAAELKARLVDIADGLQDAEARANAIEDELARLGRAEVAAAASLGRRKLSVSNVLAALQSLERSRPPALAVSPNDANEAAVAAIALAAITPELQAEIAALQTELADIEAIRQRQAEEKIELARTETALEERHRLLADALAEREARQAEDQERLRRIAAEDAKLAREAVSLRDLIARVAARGSTAPLPSVITGESGLGGPEIYARLPKQFSAAKTILPWPAAGRLISGFGARLGGGSRSEDLTLLTRPGAVVTAPFGGEVAWAEPFGRLGNVIILDVGENYSLVIIGVSRLDVRRGGRVQAGEPLGQMARGQEGQIRFQVRQGNVPVDPAQWLTAPVAAPMGG